MLWDSCDRSDIAAKLFKEPVPQKLIEYLKKTKWKACLAKVIVLKNGL